MWWLLFIGGGIWAGKRAKDAQEGKVPLDLAFKEPLTPISVLRRRLEEQAAELRRRSGAAR